MSLSTLGSSRHIADVMKMYHNASGGINPLIHFVLILYLPDEFRLLH